MQFKLSNGSYSPTASCLGDNEIIISRRYCFVSFLTLRNDFGLVLNDLVVAKIRAYNAFGIMQYGIKELGWGEYTENSEGASVKTEPKKPLEPIIR